MLRIDEMLSAVDDEQKKIDDERKKRNNERFVLRCVWEGLQKEFVQQFKPYAELYVKLRKLGYRLDEGMKIFYSDDEREYLYMRYYKGELRITIVRESNDVHLFEAHSDIAVFYDDGFATTCDSTFCHEWEISQLEKYMQDILFAVNITFSNIVKKK